ncbi:MAG: hypothetical protein DWQ36_01115 [Acidobacteria bacterium]|nr:MAG: hypothetical protein DWQ30_13905 [Acidobacteriota bacterium]REK11615.1 MAG: hypothetical protein DWQ36_01115 [Acidobacteriota bacterium]
MAALFRKDVLANAEKLVNKGKIEAAIKEYKKVLAKAPGDTNTLNRVGDLYVRLRQTDQAVEYYMKTAEQYALDGFYVKAIAVFKKVHRLDPTHLEAHRRLAELYRKQGLLNDALRHFNLVAEAMLREGNKRQAIELYEQLIELEPENPTHYLRIADIQRERGRTDEALDYYGRIAGIMLSHGQIDHAMQVYDRALRVDSKNLDFISEALVALKDAGGEERARGFLDVAIKQNPAAEQLESLITPPKVAPDSSLLDTGSQPRRRPEPPVFAEPEPPVREQTPPPAAASAPPAVEAPAPSAPPSTQVQPPDDMVELSEEPTSEVGEPQDEPEFVPEPYDPSEDSAAFEFQPEPDLETELGEAQAAPAGESEVELDPFAALLGDDEPAATEVEPPSPAEPADAAPVQQARGSVPAFDPDLDASGSLRLPKAPLPEDFPGVDREASEASDDDGLPELAEAEPVGDLAGLAADDDLLQGSGDLSLEEEPAAIELDLGLLDEAEEDQREQAAARLDESAEAEALEDTAFESLERLGQALEEPAQEPEAELEEEPQEEPEEEPEEVLEEVPAAADQSEVLERIQEAEVFAKYGLIEKALERLDEVLSDEPRHVRVLTRWIDLAVAVRPPEDVVRRARNLVREVGEDDERWQRQREVLESHGFVVEGREIEPPAVAEPEPEPEIEERATASEPALEEIAEPELEIAVEAEPEEEPEEEPEAPDDLELAAVDAETAADELDLAEEPEAEPALADELGELTALPEPEEQPVGQASRVATGFDSDTVTGDESISAASWLNEPAASGSEEELFEEEELFDLAAELQGALGEGPPAKAPAPPRGEGEQSLEEIVEGFKRGVAENIPQEDADTHYNLGIAYREMMLLDEAISEFQVSAKSEAFLVESCAMLGICFRDKGLPEIAIDWYQKALDSGAMSDEQRLGMLYEMAQTYEAMSYDDRAYETFLEVYSQNSSYRDVADCVERLRPAS